MGGSRKHIDILVKVMYIKRLHNYGIFVSLVKENVYSSKVTRPDLVSDHGGEALELTVKVLVHGDVVEVSIDKVRRALGNLERLLEAVGLDLGNGDNSVRIGDLAASAEVNTWELASVLGKLDGLANGTDGLEVTECLAHPVESAAILAESLDAVSTTREENRIEHGAAHALEVVIGRHTLSAASGCEGLPLGSDGKWKRLRSLQGSDDSVVCNRVVSICDDDGHATCLDGGVLGRELSLTEALGLLAMVGLAGLLRDRATYHLGHTLSELEIDVGQTSNHAGVDNWVVAVVELKGQRGLKMGLLWRRQRVVEQLSLVVVLAELLASQTRLHANDLLGIIHISTFLRLCGLRGLETVGPVVDIALCNLVTHLSVAVVVHDRTDGPVDGQFLPVGSEAGELSVRVTEVTALEQRVVAEADTRHDMTGAEGDLFGLCEVLVGVAVQLELTNVSDWHKLFWPHLGGIKNIEFKVVLLRLWDGLNTEVPLGVRASVNRLSEVLAVEVGVLACELQSLVPDERVHTGAKLVGYFLKPIGQVFTRGEG